MVECWNGHEFESSMGAGVRGILTNCPTCGAGTKGKESLYRVRRVAVAPELFLRWLQGEQSPAEVISNALPRDALVIGISMPDRLGCREVQLTIHSESFSPTPPAEPVQLLESPVFQRGAVTVEVEHDELVFSTGRRVGPSTRGVVGLPIQPEGEFWHVYQGQDGPLTLGDHTDDGFKPWSADELRALAEFMITRWQQAWRDAPKILADVTDLEGG